MSKQKIRDMIEVERDAIEPLRERRIVLLAEIQARQKDLDLIGVALKGMAAMMHGKHGDDLGIDLDKYILYKTGTKG